MIHTGRMWSPIRFERNRFECNATASGRPHILRPDVAYLLASRRVNGVARARTSQRHRGKRALEGDSHELTAGADTGLVKQLLQRRLDRALGDADARGD